MWVSYLNKAMTEHSGHEADPVETLRRDLSEIGQQTHTHEAILRSLSNQQDINTQRTEQIMAMVQTLVSRTSVTDAQPQGAAASRVPSPPRMSANRSIATPVPDKYAGDAAACRGFLLQCSLVFNSSPHCFPRDENKIAYVVGLLTGKALRWAEARFQDYPNFGVSFQKFVEEFRSIFGQDLDTTALSRNLWRLRQGQRSVAEFSIDFRTQAAALGWDSGALKSAFFQALNGSIRDELMLLDEPKTLDELMTLAIRIDGRLRDRNRDRLGRRSPWGGVSTSGPSPVPPHPDPEPMQIGRTRLSPEERQRRLESRLCLFCGESGHFIAACPLRTGTKLPGRVRQ
ncbi:catechol O-methyltransferase B isoform X1 [Kryptolebias marmoratus]|uniref:catechol O-methyltransferase B isoform X1 n=2 Tax=Kryptolebias marmoratus TaxID=37003 RepID=UPI0018AD0496|nr:catechol O-methyltransferase B isoform X1 [Kryptolebias marmoratus]